jgi:predicted transcriptional regulator
MVKRINVSLDEEVLQMIDDFTEKTHISRSALIGLSCRQYIDAQNKIPSLLEQFDELKKYVPMWGKGIDEMKDKVSEMQAK